jgi:hypothetical protein
MRNESLCLKSAAWLVIAAVGGGCADAKSHLDGAGSFALDITAASLRHYDEHGTSEQQQELRQQRLDRDQP